MVNETDTYTNNSGIPQRLTVQNFWLWVGTNRGRVTPFIVRVNGDNDFTVLAIGDTRVSGTDYTDVGEYGFTFSDAPSVLTLAPGESVAIGHTDANPDGTGGGGSVIVCIRCQSSRFQPPARFLRCGL